MWHNIREFVNFSHQLIYRVQPWGNTVTGVREFPLPAFPCASPGHLSMFTFWARSGDQLTDFNSWPEDSQTLCHLTELWILRGGFNRSIYWKKNIFRYRLLKRKPKEIGLFQCFKRGLVWISIPQLKINIPVLSLFKGDKILPVIKVTCYGKSRYAHKCNGEF